MADPSLDVVERVRTIRASLPETHEQVAWHGVRWRIRSHTFAHVLVVEDGKPESYAGAVADDGPVTVLAFRAPVSEIEAFASMGRPYFHGGWGRDAVGVVLGDDLDWSEVREMLTDSYRVLAPKALVARLDADAAI